jgi:hypothetical protein
LPRGERNTALDIANRAANRLIRLIYTDQVDRKVVTLRSWKYDGQQYIIQLGVKWYDRWLDDHYELTGVLTAMPDGGQAAFKVQTTNALIKSLELVEKKDLGTYHTWAML